MPSLKYVSKFNVTKWLTHFKTININTAFYVMSTNGNCYVNSIDFDNTILEQKSVSKCD